MNLWQTLFYVFLALVCLAIEGIAADAPVQIQIQGGGQIQFQINGVRVQAAGTAQGNDLVQRAAHPPVIFFPGIPSILIPNPAALADVKPGFLGVQLDTDGDGFADDAGEKKDPARKIVGVGIASVVADSPAQKAGIKEGDRVLTLEGKEAKTSAQLREMIRALKPEQAVKMTVRRDGKEIEIKATLSAAPEEIAALQMLRMNGLVIGGGNEPPAVPGIVVFNLAAAMVQSASGVSVNTFRNTPADKDSVTLRDGNHFVGKIRGIVPAKGLLLQRDGLSDLELIEEEITALSFAEREQSGATAVTAVTAVTAPTKNAPPPPKVMLQLRDGSIFHGDAITMENGTLRLTLAGGQRIEIPKEHAQSATLSNGESPQIYDGPAGLAGWTFGRSGQGQWDYKDGHLRCLTNGPITRDLGRMPDALELSFDVVFPRQMQHFGVTLFSAGMSEAGIGALMIQFSPTQISASHFDGKRSSQYTTRLAVNSRVDFSDKVETVRYRVLVDRVKGSALISINGVQSADWKLSKVKPEDIGKCGAAFSFTPHVTTSDGTFQIGRIRLLPWNGQAPDGHAEMPAPKGDQVLTGDGTATDGAIEKITDGEIHFANPATIVRRDRTLFVRFAAPPAPKVLPAAVAMVRMKDGSEFSAMQVRGSGDALTFVTRFGPEITLPLTVLREMDFFPRAGQGEVSIATLDVLTLTDGTQWRGKAITPIAGQSVRWKIAASKASLEYPAAIVAGIFFAGSMEAGKTPRLNGGSAVRFVNGDWLPGDVAALDAKHLVLKTGLSAELNVPLADLRAIYLNPDIPATVCDGATGPRLWSEGWEPNRATLTRQRVNTAAKIAQPWMYHDGAYTPAPAARTGQAMLAHRWPATSGAYAINFEVSNPGRGPSFSAQLFNSKDERTFTITMNGGRVYVYFNPSSVRLNRFGAGGKRFQVEGKSESTGDAARVTLVLDRPAKTFRVFVSGKEIGKIPFKDDEAKEALDVGGMSLNTTSYSSAMGMQNRFARIWLAPWSGSPEAEKKETGATDGAANDIPPQNFFLMNGDEFAGTIEKFRADIVTVNSDAGPLDLPVSRVAWIHFPRAAAAAFNHFPHLRFHDRGLLSVEDIHIEADRVTCKTTQGQVLDFPLSIVKEVVWRPLDEK